MKKPKIFLVLKIIASIMFISGIVLVIIGACNSRNDEVYIIPGAISMFLSIFCFIYGFLPELNKFSIKMHTYFQEENKENLSNIASNSADIMSDAVTKTAKAVKSGLKDTKYCKHCGEEIDADSKFCKKCGKEQ